MFYAGGEEEDADFNITSGASSKLANLFTLEKTASEQSLTYTAPKQPKKPGPETSTGPTPAVLHAVAVHTFKFLDQHYISQGKLGAAIIGSHDTSSYKLVLYKGKQEQVSITTIGVSFIFKVLKNKYANFYDDRRENWSILFDDEQQIIDFSKQVALAKANSAASNLSSVIVQDLTIGEGNPVEIGDSIEIKYTGWILTNHTLGKAFDSNINSEKLMRVKLGKGKVIKGWEEGLLGSKRGLKRFLIIPPSFAYGSQETDKIPANSTLIFEVLINKVKLSKESRSNTPVVHEHSDTIDAKKPEMERRREGSVSSVDESVKARGASISEQLSQSPKSEKARIISRMAKMGTPMLPMQSTTTAQPSSDSENEEEAKGGSNYSPAHNISPKPIVKSRAAISVPKLSENTFVPVQEVNPPNHQMAVFQPQYQTSSGLPFGYSIQGPQTIPIFTQGAAIGPTPTDTHLPVLISETRMQNSEVRMALGKLSDRIDLVINKMDQRSGSNLGSNQYMEAPVLQQTIERIIQENVKWKGELDVKNAKISTLNEKICDLLERNQKLVEESNNMMEKRSDTFQSSAAQSQTRLISLEKDKVSLMSQLSEAKSALDGLKVQLQRSQNEAQNNLATVSGDNTRFKGEFENLKIQIQAKEDDVKTLQDQLTEAKEQKLLLSKKFIDLQEKHQELMQSNETLEKSVDKSNLRLKEEKKNSEEELEKLKLEHRKEINSLTSKLTNTGINNEDKNRDKLLTQKLELELKEAMVQLQTLKKEKSEIEAKLSKVLPSESSSLEIKLKRAMTGLYRSLQKNISSEETYQGQEVLQTVLESIRIVTVAMLENEATQVLAQKTEPAKVEVEVPQPIIIPKDKDTKGITESVDETDNSHELGQEKEPQNDGRVVENQILIAEDESVNDEKDTETETEVQYFQANNESAKVENSRPLLKASPPKDDTVKLVVTWCMVILFLISSLICFDCFDYKL